MKTVLFILILFPFVGIAQLLDNSNGHAFTEKPFFNSTFVQKNQVKTIRGTYTYKKMGDIMRETKYVYEYQFSRRGHLTQTFETKKINAQVDTTIINYTYDYLGNLAFVRKRDSYGYISTHYFYDSINRVIKEEYRRDIDTVGTILVPKFERSTVLNAETITYQKNNSNFKAIIHNNYGFPYKEIHYNFDTNGYLVEEIETLKLAAIRTTTSYTYNAKGWISSVKVTHNDNPKNNEEITFKYDEFGNLIEKKSYKGAEFKTEIQIIYNLKTGLLSSIITRDVATNFLTILRFDEIEYYE